MGKKALPRGSKQVNVPRRPRMSLPVFLHPSKSQLLHSCAPHCPSFPGAACQPWWRCRSAALGTAQTGRQSSSNTSSSTVDTYGSTRSVFSLSLQRRLHLTQRSFCCGAPHRHHALHPRCVCATFVTPGVKSQRSRPLVRQQARSLRGCSVGLL